MTKNAKTLTLTARSTLAGLTKPAQPAKVRTLTHAADPVQVPVTVTVVTKSRSRLADKLPRAAAHSTSPAGMEVFPAMPPASAQPKAVVVRKSAKKTTEANESSAQMSAVGLVRTADAAALAAIDTSSYALPTTKVAARRGRRPAEFQPEQEEVAALNVMERSELRAASRSKARHGAAQSADNSALTGSSDENTLEAQREKMSALIAVGHSQGYLTYTQINDHLPEEVASSDAIEGLVASLNEIGITVYEQAPDAEALLLSENAVATTSDEDAEAAVANALSAVNADFGRTTDPVRMYMREMASAALLTRQQEIDIARRIEDGLTHMMQAIAACPATIAEVLHLAEKIETGQMNIDDAVDGIAETQAILAPERLVEENTREEDTDQSEELSEVEDDTPAVGAAGMSDKEIEVLRANALAIFSGIKHEFARMNTAREQNGYGVRRLSGSERSDHPCGAEGAVRC